MNRFPGVLVRNALQHLTHRDFDAKFFAQFPLKTSLKSLVALPLAAGEFPQPAQVRTGVTLGDEQSTFPEDKASGDLNWRASVAN